MGSIVNNLKNKEDYQILVSADIDDEQMDIELDFKNSIICFGVSKSKVDAINRDIELAEKDWDIIVNMSDDMRFTFYGFDEIIRQQFEDGDLDKLIHIPDQDAKSALATMYIAGRDYYERFGFIYNPVYHSLFCDNEVHEIAIKLGKYRFVNCSGVLEHLNPAYGHLPKDEMFISQQEVGWTKDQETYLERKAKNFYL
jgi:hypothetical protein